MLFNLWNHQREAINRAKPLNYFALFFEPGCGKSRTTLEILKDKYQMHGGLMSTLILAPPVVCPNWLNEIKKFTNIPDKKVVVLSGPGPRRIKQFNEMLKKHGTSFIAISNYEGLVAIKDLYNAFASWSPEVIVFDESQRIKAHDSKRSKAAHKLAKTARFRYLLSGSPILNSPMDIWSQYRAMDLGAGFGDSFWLFRAKYFYDKNANMPANVRFPNWVFRESARGEFQEIMSSTAAIVKKIDCLDLPPLLKQVVYIELGSEQRKHYDSMKKEFITFLDSGACTAQLAITKALRLQQIVSGHLVLDTAPGEEPKVVSLPDNPRIAALKEQLELILEDPDRKCLVWACWKHDYAVIRGVCDELGVKSVEIHGGVSSNAKSSAISDFCSDPGTRVLIGHPGSGGVGINLVEASYMIYYSRNFNLENDIQSEARNYRAGSERHTSVTRIDLVAKDTIDEEVQKSLANKIAIGESLLRSLT